MDSNFAPGGVLEGWQLTTADVEGTMNDQDDNSDSDGVAIAGFPGASFGVAYTTGELGQNNHTLDFGFSQPVFDAALIKQLADGSNLGTVAPGDTVTFNITVATRDLTQ